jgi:hypothetical protein
MGNYTLDTRVWVCPFTRQDEEQEIIIGRLDTAVFLVLPSDAVELLDNLAQGKTIREALFLYQEKHNEVPDIEDLLTALELQGFVQPLDSKGDWQNSSTTRHTKSKPIRYHFSNFPQSLAKRIFSQRAVLIYSGVIGLGCMAIVLDPSVIPTWKAHFFKENFTVMRLGLVLINCLILFLHEMAHLVAARAVGISSQMGISHRLWFLVAETDMTGVWSVPRYQRYLPFLAGILLDATSAAILILLLFAHNREWLNLHPVALQLSRAILLTYLMSLLWQCYLFMRTDFYFVLANFFRCKNLMKDTEAFLQNQVYRILRTKKWVDQSHIPRSERRVIRWYSVLWLIGRIAALSSLTIITVPLIWQYGLEIIKVLGNGYAANPYAFIDALVMLFVVFAFQGLGFGLWTRSLYIYWRKNA